MYSVENKKFKPFIFEGQYQDLLRCFMKVALITLHRIVNYGSVLQTYATQHVFRQLGHKVEVLDYYDERMTILGMLRRLKTKKKILRIPILLFLAQLVMFPSYLKRFSVFKEFLKRYINLSPKTYKSFDELKGGKHDADIFCTGSDQVWNSTWNEKIDRCFFLDFVPLESRCFSYAASFGKDRLAEEEMPETKELLKKYEFISTRESSGVDILCSLGYIDAINVLDPTLLLKPVDWMAITSKKYERKKYILIYNLNRNGLIEKCANELSNIKKLPIYSISYCYHEILRAGRVLVSIKVEHFLSLIANAEYVLTDSFHATAFSANFGRKLFIFYPEHFSARLANIVSLTGIEDRVVSDQDDFAAVIDKKMNPEEIQKKLERHRSVSINFLKNVFSSIVDGEIYGSSIYKN